jgi:hypothetical protein
MTPLAPNSRTKSSLTSQGWISQYTRGFAHATGNQLGDLGAEIEDEDLSVHDGVPGARGQCAARLPARTSVDAVVRRFLGDLHVVHVRSRGYPPR